MVCKQFKGQVKNSKSLWKDILRHYYGENESGLYKLLETKDDILIFANEISYLGGIGLIAGQENTLIQKKWTFPNIVGDAMMELRTEFMEKEKDDKSKTIRALQESRTREEDIKHKVGSIIGSMKKRQI